MNTVSPTICDLQGLWRRSLLIGSDGARDTTTEVWWLQGKRLYADLRRPAAGPDFSTVRGLAQLSSEQCAWLARQQGFAGELTQDGQCFEWQRSIDFQPASPQADAGTLQWKGDVLVETGRDSPYIEHWRRQHDRSVQPGLAISLREGDTGVPGLLLRAGAEFMFARARETTLPAGRNLAECVAEARSLRDAHLMLDCEISFGQVAPDGFRIAASTLPYRVGDILGQRMVGDTIVTDDRGSRGEPIQRRWVIIAAEGALDAIR
jgi:hypothetical protein